MNKLQSLTLYQFFHAMRKHLAWYCRGFDGARGLRKELIQTNSNEEVGEIFDGFQ